MSLDRAPWHEPLTGEEAAALDPGAAAGAARRPDLLVVGGGAVGTATAALCRRSRLGTVALVDAGTLGCGATGGSAGLLAPDAQPPEVPRFMVELGRRSLGLWRELDGAWPGGLGLVDLDWLRLEGPSGEPLHPPARGALQVDVAEVRRLVPGLAVPRRGLLIRGQARVNPLRTVARLARRAGAVASRLPVTDVVVRGGRIVEVATPIGSISPGAVVFATGEAPALLRLGLAQTRVKGHLLVTDPAPFRLPGTVEGVATQLEDGRLLAGGTLDVDDHRADVRPAVIASIRAQLDAELPWASKLRTSHAWCCFRPTVGPTVGGVGALPVVDRVPGTGNGWFTCGHAGTGILMAAVVGQAVARWIDGGKPPREVDGLGLEARRLMR